MHLSSQVRAHQLVLPPCDVVIKAVADYVRNIHDTSDLDAIAKDVFQHSQVTQTERTGFGSENQAVQCVFHQMGGLSHFTLLARPKQERVNVDNARVYGALKCSVHKMYVLEGCFCLLVRFFVFVPGSFCVALTPWTQSNPPASAS